MKLKKKNIVILITLQLIFIAVNNCFYNLNIDPLTKEQNLESRDETSFKTSGFWVLDPIIIDGSAVGIGGHDWNWVESQSWFGGGDGSWTNPYIIENITINGQNSDDCITIVHSNVSFILRNCTLYNSHYNNRNGAAINLYDVNNSKIIGNNFSFNNGNGIRLNYGNNNTFTGNIINTNSADGILIKTAQKNTISGNTLNFNDLGISLDDCNSTSVSGNTIYSSNNGLKVIDSNNNTFSNNKIYGITEIGVILLANPGVCANNLFYINNFTNFDGINAIDNGTNNQWDNGVIGNYWHDYTGSDKNDDGIGDTPYQIAGSAESQDNYPIWDDGLEQPKRDNTIIVIIIIVSIVGGAMVAATIFIVIRRRMRGEGVISDESGESELT